jgi:hypothetical protein
LGGLQFEFSLGKWFVRPRLQNKQSKIGWKCGSSGRVQALSPEFKPQSHKKKKARRQRNVFFMLQDSKQNQNALNSEVYQRGEKKITIKRQDKYFLI